MDFGFGGGAGEEVDEEVGADLFVFGGGVLFDLEDGSGGEVLPEGELGGGGVGELGRERLLVLRQLGGLPWVVGGIIQAPDPLLRFLTWRINATLRPCE